MNMIIMQLYKEQSCSSHIIIIIPSFPGSDSQLQSSIKIYITANNLTTKLLYTFCFIAIALGSTIALPVHEQSQMLEIDSSDTDIIDFTKIEKRAVSRCKIKFCHAYACSSILLLYAYKDQY